MAALVITYALVFLVGPLVVLWLLRPASAVPVIRRLGIVTIGFVMAAMVAPMLGASAALNAALLWAAWILSMAVVGHVLRLVVGDGPGTRRWTSALAAIGATVPWFGIMLSRMMAV